MSKLHLVVFFYFAKELSFSEIARELIRVLPIGLKPSLRAGLAFCKSPTLSLRMIGQANSMPLVLKGRLPTEPSFLGNIQHGIDRKSCGQCVSRACFSSMEGAT
jgi:hypothetical protein